MQAKAILLANLATAGLLMGLSACNDNGSDPPKEKACYTHDCKGLNCCMGYTKDGSKHSCAGLAPDSFTVADAKAIGCTKIEPDSKNPTCMPLK